MAIIFRQSGSFNNIEKFLNGAKKIRFEQLLQKYAAQGVAALELATPKDSGITAGSWDYTVETRRSGFRISWTNDSMKEGVPIAILIQYGHGTRSGSFVQGRDFINPTMRPIFETISDNLWKEITEL